MIRSFIGVTCHTHTLTKISNMKMGFLRLLVVQEQTSASHAPGLLGRRLREGISTNTRSVVALCLHLCAHVTEENLDRQSR